MTLRFCRIWLGTVTAAAVIVTLSVRPVRGNDKAEFFAQRVAPILKERCVECHNGTKSSGGLDLTARDKILQGGDQGPAIVPGKARESVLPAMIEGAEPEMPKKGGPLTQQQVADIKAWIDAGAVWPANLRLTEGPKSWEERLKLWSLQPLVRTAPPALDPADEKWVHTPIDRFVLAKLREKGLAPAAQADRRTLLRRLYFDLVGLPPTPEEVERFQNDSDPNAYEKKVDRLLDSPHYGERWARHWLDVVHYGDTHGYDKDKLRPNAWPYRDYVIRAFNEDKPYARFVQEQIAGDVFYPDTRDGIVALGLLATGPWDFVGQVELREGTLDKQITRNLDRDDMVATAMNTFASLTVQCARCHDHKFDPIKQEDYYSLQAVFAAVDRADRPYEPDPEVSAKRAALLAQQTELEQKRQNLLAAIAEKSTPDLKEIDKEVAALDQAEKRPAQVEFGYHSAIVLDANLAKWVQIDLGEPKAIEHIVLVGCHDTFNNIGAGFGFPVRYKIELADNDQFKSATVVEDQTAADSPNPGVRPQAVAIGGKKARYVRVTATKLAPRAGDLIFALAELSVFDADGNNLAAGKPVQALDSIEAAPRWGKQNLVDGYYFDAPKEDRLGKFAQLIARRKALLDSLVDSATRKELEEIHRGLTKTAAQLAALPKPSLVYAAATDFAPSGSFTATQGKPRPIHLLHRGSEKNPKQELTPGTVACIAGLEARFELPSDHAEGQRRAALANWLVDARNPLTWRSIVNRIWLYHFGRGLVETPNDFGHMGVAPTHPELLDWLAVEFRDGSLSMQAQSLKQLHKLIVTSAVYRQSSTHHEGNAAIDEGNRYLWRMNRRRLEAEALRDSVLAISGKLNTQMYGPGFRPFGFKDDHSPHYLYEEHDPDKPASQRRSIYRFLVRSVPEPFMETLDCADPSLLVERRNETLTALQALALLNNKFMVRMAQHFALRVETMGGELAAQIAAAYRLALGRPPKEMELELLLPLAKKHGLANVCRLIFNSNEFCFVD